MYAPGLVALCTSRRSRINDRVVYSKLLKNINFAPKSGHNTTQHTCCNAMHNVKIQNAAFCLRMHMFISAKAILSHDRFSTSITISLWMRSFESAEASFHGSMSKSYFPFFTWGIWAHGERASFTWLTNPLSVVDDNREVLFSSRRTVCCRRDENPRMFAKFLQKITY